jgi:hypothetical protein
MLALFPGPSIAASGVKQEGFYAVAHSRGNGLMGRLDVVA